MHRTFEEDIIQGLAELSTAYWSVGEQMGRQVGERGRRPIWKCLFSWLFSEKMTTKNSSVLFFCKTENNRHAVKLPKANNRQTWAAAYSSSSLVQNTMRDVATMWYYWVWLCFYKMWSKKGKKKPLWNTWQARLNEKMSIGLEPK